MKERRNYGLYTGKKGIHESVLKEAQTLKILDKDFPMFKELRKTKFK